MAARAAPIMAAGVAFASGRYCDFIPWGRLADVVWNLTHAVSSVGYEAHCS